MQIWRNTHTQLEPVFNCFWMVPRSRAGEGLRAKGVGHRERDRDRETETLRSGSSKRRGQDATAPRGNREIGKKQRIEKTREEPAPARFFTQLLQPYQRHPLWHRPSATLHPPRGARSRAASGAARPPTARPPRRAPREPGDDDWRKAEESVRAGGMGADPRIAEPEVPRRQEPEGREKIAAGLVSSGKFKSNRNLKPPPWQYPPKPKPTHELTQDGSPSFLAQAGPADFGRNRILPNRPGRLEPKNSANHPE